MIAGAGGFFCGFLVECRSSLWRSQYLAFTRTPLRFLHKHSPFPLAPLTYIVAGDRLIPRSEVLVTGSHRHALPFINAPHLVCFLLHPNLPPARQPLLVWTLPALSFGELLFGKGALPSSCPSDNIFLIPH